MCHGGIRGAASSYDSSSVHSGQTMLRELVRMEPERCASVLHLYSKVQAM